MERVKAISLNNLARSHSEEIDQMLFGIIGSAAGTLWTAELRPANRGGKPCFITRIKEASPEDGTN